MKQKIDYLIEKLKDETAENAFQFSDELAEIETPYVLNELIFLLKESRSQEVKYLVARTLSLLEENEDALIPLLEEINKKENVENSGGLTAALEGFDCSQKFVEIFKLYLFGSYKTQAMAKLILDDTEFEITARTVRKAEKHWKHYCNNTKQDEVFALKKVEIEEMLHELKALF